MLGISCFWLVAGHGFAAPDRSKSDYEQSGDVVWQVPTKDKVIALTFDDGPDPTNTPAILDLLEKYNAKSTFFLVGDKVERSPQLVQREMAFGHELANHTYSHSYLSRRMTPDQMRRDILHAESVIMAITGKKCELFRPPGGVFNAGLVSQLKQEGYTIVMWTWHQDTRDWSRPGVKKITDTVLNHARNGDIVLFHEYINGKSQTIAALEIILPELIQRGYRFVTISELLTYRVKNTDPPQSPSLIVADN
ncbi:polysaccharide deacetylase family protein [Paenibacillus aurantiacus]|uniref:Polysaccharide deacetylase family protein n=1 Tax=Paenibacillus aurantiacus TaxID=1936118 RepID=A0ABV5KWQ0_9BACL